jgi:hypothetical protein
MRPRCPATPPSSMAATTAPLSFRHLTESRDKLPHHVPPDGRSHPRAYAAFGRGDIDGYLRPCAEDFAFHVPGNGSIAVTYSGRDGLYDLAGKAIGITDGTFQEEVEACSTTTTTLLFWRCIASRAAAY